jgi:hypothetical protein
MDGEWQYLVTARKRKRKGKAGKPVGREYEGLWFGRTAFLRRKHSEFDCDQIEICVIHHNKSFWIWSDGDWNSDHFEFLFVSGRFHEGHEGEKECCLSGFWNW